MMCKQFLFKCLVQGHIGIFIITWCITKLSRNPTIYTKLYTYRQFTIEDIYFKMLVHLVNCRHLKHFIHLRMRALFIDVVTQTEQ